MECARHPRGDEAFVSESVEASTSGRDADAGTSRDGESGDEPNGRLEWVINRAQNSRYQNTDEFKADVERTWAFLEDKWTREGAKTRMDAARVVREYFDSKWLSRGIGERGGLVCIGSVGISPETIQMKKSSSLYSLNSLAERANTNDWANATGETAFESETNNVKVIEDDRAKELQALDRCVHVIKNFISQPEALSFKDPFDPQSTDYANYCAIIKEPMDLSTVLRRLESKQCESPQQVWDMCNLIWSNCRLYYPSTSKMQKLCDQAELMLTAAWRAEGLEGFIGTPIDGSCNGQSKTRGVSLRKGSGVNTATSTKTGGRVAAFKCDVCKRSKKGRCGTESAPKSCLTRPENQTIERQAKIKERVSKLKPFKAACVKKMLAPDEELPVKRMIGKRKLTEAEQQESRLRRVFDETDPENFISQILETGSGSQRTDFNWDTTAHLANEQLRLEVLANQQLARYEESELSQRSNDGPNSRNAASIETLQTSMKTTTELLKECNLKLQVCNIIIARTTDDSKRETYVSERYTLEGQIRALHKRHQQQALTLRRLVLGKDDTPKPARISPEVSRQPRNASSEYTDVDLVDQFDQFISVATVFDGVGDDAKNDVAPEVTIENMFNFPTA